jgi:hypothetical protein
MELRGVLESHAPALVIDEHRVPARQVQDALRRLSTITSR